MAMPLVGGIVGLEVGDAHRVPAGEAARYGAEDLRCAFLLAH
jgi:hypothetical protein